MISLVIVFYMFVILFGFIGAMRGWAKEILVTFSVILALAFISVIELLLPMVGPFIQSNPSMQYWFRILTVVLMAFFGYQSPKFSRLSKAAERRDRIQDVMLGMFLGLVSGWFVIGTLWYYTHQADYPMLAKYVVPAQGDMAESMQRILKLLPPVWLGKQPNIYIAVVLAFIFVIIVFL
ncbi:MAG: hypothetical protein AB1894_18995 [Chloroflexota bacterium]